MSERAYYEAITSLADVYLEDSHVLGLAEEPGSISFEMDFVLTEGHPFYAEPKPAEQYCYQRGWLVFAGLGRVAWAERTFRPITDATGAIDYGNIDAFSVDGRLHRLEGEWGQLEVEADIITVRFDDE
jgi:hypothetical protein